jgi:hypothetical protein
LHQKLGYWHTGRNPECKLREAEQLLEQKDTAALHSIILLIEYILLVARTPDNVLELSIDNLVLAKSIQMQAIALNLGFRGIQCELAVHRDKHWSYKFLLET